VDIVFFDGARSVLFVAVAFVALSLAFVAVAFVSSSIRSTLALTVGSNLLFIGENCSGPSKSFI
jgi:hypothetical protein